LRITSSGFVSFPLMPDIIRLRVCLSTTSVTAQTALAAVHCRYQFPLPSAP
jgi:hypothetical protein